MDIFKKVNDTVLGLGLEEKLGAFLIPALVLASLVLLFFARHSFKLFKIGLPLLGLAAGYFAGYKYLGKIVAEKLPEVAKTADPAVVAGVACALVLAIICLKMRTLTVLAIGVCVGYAFVGETVITLLRKLSLVKDILGNVDMKTAVTLAAILSVICAAVTMVILKKFFNLFYIAVTSIGCAMAALIIPAIFLASAFNLPFITITLASDIGAFIGFIFFVKQYLFHRYVW